MFGFLAFAPKISKITVHAATRLRRRDALVQRIARSTHKTRPSAASSYQAVFMGRRPIPRQRGLFVKSPLWNPEKQRLTFIAWIVILCSQGIKRPAYTPPIRLRRRDALVQRIARSTHKTRPSAASSYQADFCSQGIKRPAYTPPAFDGLYSLRMSPSYTL